MANLLRVKSIGIYYTDGGHTNPDDIEATYQKVDEDVKESKHFCEFVPTEDVYLDEYVDRCLGVVSITPNQVVREVTGLRDFIAEHLDASRVLEIGVAYESKLVTRSFKQERDKTTRAG